MRSAVLAIILALFLTSCGKFFPKDRGHVPDGLPEKFSIHTEHGPGEAQWWKNFESSELNDLIFESFKENFSIKEAWARLEQARFTAAKSGADLQPSVNISTGTTYSEKKTTGVASNTDNWSLGLSASYEFDFWGKIKAQNESKIIISQASREDVKSAIMTVTSQIAESWIKLISLKQQEDLFNKQLNLQKQLLQVIKMRFSWAKATALDIYQQQQSIERVEAAIIPVLALQKSLKRQLALLTGKTSLETPLITRSFPGARDVPEIGLPISLIAHRPDIQSAWMKLKSAEWDIAAAEADRLPALKLTASHTYSSDEIGSIFDNWLWNLAGNLAAPLLDGARRKAELSRTKSVVDERLATYRKTVYGAVLEVEDALSEEERYAQTIQSLNERIVLSQKTLREATRRYLNGSSEIINVLQEELNSLLLQQDHIKAKEQMIIARIHLHKALGGSWLNSVADTKVKTSKQAAGNM